MVRPAAESAISVARRRSRVSGCLALTTQCVAVRWYQGGRDVKNAQAFALARNALRCAGVELRRLASCSKL